MLFRFLLLAAFYVSPALAQTGFVAGNGQPVSINAEQLEWRQNEKAYVARGNAEVSQDGVTLRAGTIVASYSEVGGGNRVTSVKVEGGVHIISANGEVFGQQGTYDLDKQVAILTGDNLKLVSGADTVTARDTLEFWQQDNKAIARGAATAVREGQSVAADVLTAFLVKDKAGKMSIDRMKADGGVVITTPTEIARAAKGNYNLKKQLATLEGNVRITRGQNQLNGERAVVNMATGISTLTAAPGKKVKALMVKANDP
jgi:lipopolysaccharide export system protein LptA